MFCLYFDKKFVNTRITVAILIKIMYNNIDTDYFFVNF